jgi:hypothetical protein
MPLLVAVCFGSVLRLLHFYSQILVDDEWHAVHKLLTGSYMSILTDFGSADHCIPLTLLYRFLSDWLWLSEVMMRLPVLLVGLVSLLLIPLIFRELIGRPASILLAWLLAVSPLHIYYSRIARPYGISLLLAILAIGAFFKWWSGHQGRWMWVYLLGASIGPFFSLTVMPAVWAPIGFAALAITASKETWKRSWNDLLKLGLAVAIAQTVFLAPPLIASSGAITEKLASGTINWQTLAGFVQLMAGTINPYLLALLAILIAVGAVELTLERIGFSLYLLSVVVIQVLAVLVAQPAHLNHSIVLARYNLVLLPLLLLWVAVGGLRLAQRLPHPVLTSSGVLAGAAVIVLLLFLGPLPEIYFWPNNWVNQGVFQYDYDQSRLFETHLPEEIPPFYAELSRRDRGSDLVLEAPWNYNWHYFPYYQKLHGQHTVIGFVGDGFRFGEVPLDRSSFRFVNGLHLDNPEEVLDRGVSLVVFHKNLIDEMPGPFPQQPVDMSPWISKYAEAFGAPVYEDEYVTVFDLSSKPVRKVDPRDSER